LLISRYDCRYDKLDHLLLLSTPMTMVMTQFHFLLYHQAKESDGAKMDQKKERERGREREN
jgi:hypothetical protein